jgi:NAD(P)-dependent dehydrogenase (short-subunit alcohol dehydrogenase family)
MAGEDGRRNRELSGRVAIVTGANLADAGPNIGAAIVAELAESGAAVVAAGRTLEGAEHAAAAVRADGGRAIAVHVDVRDESSVRDMIAATVEEFGGVDILCNNAGGSQRQLDRDILSMDVGFWDDMFALNCRAAMLGCKHAIPSMIERGGGAIVNTSSGSSLAGDVNLAAYGSSKAALNAFTKYVATQFGRRGVRCNTVIPGYIRSVRAWHINADSTHEMFRRHTVLDRFGEPSDIADMVVYLASPRSSFVTGQCVTVDGGLNIHRPFFADMMDAPELTEVDQARRPD